MSEVARTLVLRAGQGAWNEVDHVLAVAEAGWRRDVMTRAVLAVSFVKSLLPDGYGEPRLVNRLPDALRFEFFRQLAEPVGTYPWELPRLRSTLGEQLVRSGTELGRVVARHRRHRRWLAIPALAADLVWRLEELALRGARDAADMALVEVGAALELMWQSEHRDGRELVRCVLFDLGDVVSAAPWAVERLPPDLRAEFTALFVDETRADEVVTPGPQPGVDTPEQQAVQHLAGRQRLVRDCVAAHMRTFGEMVPELLLPAVAEQVIGLAERRRWRAVAAVLDDLEAVWQMGTPPVREVLAVGFVDCLDEQAWGHPRVISSLPDGLRYAWARGLAEPVDLDEPLRLEAVVARRLLAGDRELAALVERQLRYRDWVGVDALVVDLAARILELSERRRQADRTLGDLLVALDRLHEAGPDGEAVVARTVAMLDLVLRRDRVAEHLPPRLRDRVAGAPSPRIPEPLPLLLAWLRASRYNREG